MNNLFSDRLNMFNAVLTVCDQYPEAVQSIPALASGVAILREQSTALHQKLAIQTQSSTVTLTQTKNDRRDRALRTATNLAKRLRSASLRLKQPMLTDQLLFSVSALQALTEKEQLFRLQTISDRINSNLLALKDWGMTAEMLADFRVEVEAYEGLSGSPTNRIIERSTITRSLQNEIAALLDFVRNDLQLLVETIGETRHAQFAQQTLRAMQIRLTGSSSGGQTEEKEIDTRDEAVKSADLRNQERLAAAPPTVEKAQNPTLDAAEKAKSQPSPLKINSASRQLAAA